MKKIDPDWTENGIISGIASGEALITSLTLSDEDTGRRQLIHMSEFAQLLRTQQRSGNTLQDIVRQAWDSTKLSILRAKAKDCHIVEDAHVSAVGHITPEELTGLLGTSERSNGYANRFLWLYVDRSKLLAFPTEPDKGVLEEFISRLAFVVSGAKETGQLSMSGDALPLWEAMYRQLADDSLEYPDCVAPVMDRSAPQVIRLAMIYSLLDEQSIINQNHLKAGYAIWKYSEESVKHVFVGSSAKLSREQQRLYDKLKNRGVSGLSTTDHSQIFKGNRKASQLADDREYLKSLGLIIERSQETEGRAKSMWYLTEFNPLKKKKKRGKKGEEASLSLAA